MKWFKKKEELVEKWQFYVVDNTNKGYRINLDCQPLWETPDHIPQYFLGTKTQAIQKKQDILEKWLITHGHTPHKLEVQDYVDIPHYKSEF